MSITGSGATIWERLIGKSASCKRMVDVVAVSVALPLLLPLLLIITIAVKLTSKGPVLYWSNRVGIDNNIFLMPKFRTMRVGTPEVSTDVMVGNAGHYLTAIGSFLRRASLDELPQFLCVWRGDMGLVGPRPALFNQYDLIALRTEAGVHKLVPGITGWAQVNGRDALTIRHKVKFDSEYLDRRSLSFDRKILFITLGRVLYGDGVSH